MRRTRFSDDPCPLARTADLLGDWWTPLVLREMLFGRTHFSDIQENLNINRSLLTQRLQRFEDDGIAQKRQYTDRPPRYEYVLTDKGRDLWPVLSVMWAFGDRWLTDDGPSPIRLVDKDSGRQIQPTVIDAHTGGALDVATTRRRRTSD